MMENLKVQLNGNDIEMIVTEQFTDDPKPALQNLKVRCIV